MERECPTCAASFLDEPSRRTCPACGDVLPVAGDTDDLPPVVVGTVAELPGLSEFLYLVGPPRPSRTPVPRAG